MGFSLKLDERVPERFSGVGPDGLLMEPRSIRLERAAQREPVKFEAGQVVRLGQLKPSNGAPFIVAQVDHDTVRLGVIGIPENPILINRAGYEPLIELISPAPQPADTWSNGESVVFIHGSASGLRIVSEGEPFVGGTVAVARRLWEGGYRRANPPLRVRAGEPAPRDIAKGEMIEVEIRALGASMVASALMNEARERQVDFDDACRRVVLDLDVSTADATHAISSVCAALPWSSAQVFAAISAGDERVWHMLRAHIKLRGVRSERAKSERAAQEQQRVDETDDQLRTRLKARFAPRESGTFTVTIPPLAPGSYILAMSPHDGTAEVRDAHGALVPGVSAHRQPRIDAMTPQSPFDGIRADRATGDNLRKIDESLRAIPALRAGDVVRREPCEFLKRVAWGRVVSVTATTLRMHWLGDSGPWEYGPHDVASPLRDGRWRVVTPDVRPLASLANAVAAIFARPDLATSRRFIDQAIASLRGEPFAAAVATALVAAGDAPMSPYQIAALVRGARAHEARRSEVAPARRTLTDGQIHECFAAAMRASCGEWYVRLSHVYERARTA